MQRGRSDLLRGALLFHLEPFASEGFHGESRCREVFAFTISNSTLISSRQHGARIMDPPGFGSHPGAL